MGNGRRRRRPLKYTARDGGESLKDGASTEVINRRPSKGIRLFSARHEFPSAWHRFLHPDVDSDDQTLTLALTKDRFPFLFQNRAITINEIELFMKVKDDLISASTLRLSPAPDRPVSDWPAPDRPVSDWNDKLLHTVYIRPDTRWADWTLSAWLEQEGRHTRFDADAIEDIVVVCHYSVSEASALTHPTDSG